MSAYTFFCRKLDATFGSSTFGLCTIPTIGALACVKDKEFLQIANSDIIKGSIRIPIAQVLMNQRARSGSCQTLPFD